MQLRSQSHHGTQLSVHLVLTLGYELHCNLSSAKQPLCVCESCWMNQGEGCVSHRVKEKSDEVCTRWYKYQQKKVVGFGIGSVI